MKVYPVPAVHTFSLTNLQDAAVPLGLGDHGDIAAVGNCRNNLHNLIEKIVLNTRTH